MWVGWTQNWGCGWEGAQGSCPKGLPSCLGLLLSEAQAEMLI